MATKKPVEPLMNEWTHTHDITWGDRTHPVMLVAVTPTLALGYRSDGLVEWVQTGRGLVRRGVVQKRAQLHPMTVARRALLAPVEELAGVLRPLEDGAVETTGEAAEEPQA
jgi:hypothetical protein